MMALQAGQPYRAEHIPGDSPLELPSTETSNTPEGGPPGATSTRAPLTGGFKIDSLIIWGGGYY